jgi:tRNA pseudouridine55 synthase
MLFGLLNINKPSGLTSRRVVDRIQRLVKPAKVGHAGTLDPLASGVLVIGVGQATRLVEYVQQMPKCYRATFVLGCTSTTEDVEGEVTRLVDARLPTRDQIERAAAELTGEILQRPPAFSALKVDGRRAYARARAGETVDLAPRTIRVHRLRITAYDYPNVQMEIECSSGTYVRSLGRDLAERLGTAAVMSALVRTAIGRFTLEESLDPRLLTRENICRSLLPPILAVQDLMPMRVVSEQEAQRLCNGLPIGPLDQSTDHCAAVDAAGNLVAIVNRRPDGAFGPSKSFKSR